MIWLAWRLQRSVVIAVAALAILLIGFAVVIGVIQHHDLAAYGHAPCFGKQQLTGTSDRCGYLAVDLANIQTYDPYIRYAGLIIAPLVGAIIGLFAIVSELDQRTARFAWTQSASRLHWFEAKVGVGTLLVAIILVPTSIVLSWWNGAIDNVDRLSRFSFALAGWDLVAYGLFAFALTVVVGSIIRRTGWALAAVIVLYLGVAFAVPTEVRPHLAPVTVLKTPFVTPSGATVQLPDQLNELEIVVGMFPRSYRGPFTTNESLATQSRFFACASDHPGKGFTAAVKAQDKCYRTLDLWYVSEYIANDQFWTLQLYEGLLYLGVGLILVGGAYALVCRVEP